MTDQNKEQELIEQLGSDKRSLRIQAIGTLTRVGNSKTALEAVRNLMNSTDREESFFASQAAAKIAQRLAPKNSVYQESASKVDYSDIHNLTPKNFLECPKSDAQSLLSIIRRHANEIPEEVLPSVGVFLGKYGDVNDAPFISNYLMHNSSNMTLPYISAAERINPVILTPVLPNLLASEESLVRSRAVMALRKIDSTEAERHFLRLLSSKAAEDRLAAIEISFLFPFERVKDYLTALLAEENDPDVLKASATILASNPSKDIALKILDILESLPPEPRKRVTVIFNIVSASIASSGVLPAKEATPEALVKAWKEQRLENFLNDLEIQLSTSTGPKRDAIVSWLEKNRSIPRVKEFIEHLAINPQTEDVYQRLTGQNLADTLSLPSVDNLLNQHAGAAQRVAAAQAKSQNIQSQKRKAQQSVLPAEQQEVNQVSQPGPNSAEAQKNTSTARLSNAQGNQTPASLQQSQPINVITAATFSKAAIEEQTANTPDLTSLAETSQETTEEPQNISNHEDETALIEHYKNLELEDFMNEKSKIIEVSKDSSASVPVRVEALKALLRLSPDLKIKEPGKIALAEQDNKLKTAGFKILERVAPDYLKEHLHDLLLDEDAHIRVRAIRFGLKIDARKSIEALESLMQSEDQTTRSNAISCLALCPFENIYPILIKSLQKETHPLVAKQITSILVSNPANGILTTLDKLNIINENPNIEMVISQARNDLEEILSNLSPEEKQNFKDIKEVDLFTEQPQEDKPYSVENVRKINQKNKEQKAIEETPWLQRDGNQFKLLGVVFILLVSISVGLFFVQPPEDIDTQSKGASNFKQSGSKSSGKSTIPTTFRMNKPCTIKGNVVNKISDISIVVKHNEREVMVKFENSAAKDYEVGDTVSVTCVPYRENPSKVILAKGQKISMVKKGQGSN